MRRILIILMMLPVVCWGQKITAKKHPVTDVVSVQTSWIPFFKQGIKTRGFEMDARMLREDGDYFLELRITDQVRTHLVTEGHSLGFFNGEKKVLALVCSNGNKGREELDFLRYPITEDQMDMILKNDVNRVVFEWERGFSDDKFHNDYLLLLRNSMSMVKDNKRVDGKEMQLTGWVRIFKGSDPKTVIWQRIIGTDTGVYLQLKMFGREVKRGHRLNIYNSEEKISLFAKSVNYEHSRGSGRDYSYPMFPLTKEDVDFLAKSNYSKVTLQTSKDKIITTDVADMRADLNKLALRASSVYFH